MKEILLITPPFVQLSSPYPAIAFLSGAFKSEGYQTKIFDLSISTALMLFSKRGITELFDAIQTQLDSGALEPSEEMSEYLSKRELYIETIEPVIAFLQGKYPSLAHKILRGDYLPKASRFKNALSQQGRKHSANALHLASLYIDDILDLCINTVIPDFGLSSYKEAVVDEHRSFDDIKKGSEEENLLTKYLNEQLDTLNFDDYSMVCITIPFSGNLCFALRIASYIKKHSKVNVVFGGGWVNTNLRHLQETAVFEYADYISLDDGELSLLRLLDYFDGKITRDSLIRTYYLEGGKVHYSGNDNLNYTGSYTPDYAGLNSQLPDYFTLKESINPMHSLWSERLFLKLRMAHGCYHHRCTFCDTSLDYVNNYYADTAEHLFEMVEEVVNTTGVRSFHFIDEAMPPALTRDFALLLLERKLDITWWGNIRFDRAFNSDLPRLMARAGCIAVTGGIESADNRVLSLIQKGSTIEDMARVCRAFSSAGILTHAYMIYGFPTETTEECINSLEVIRQMFAAKILDSAFYHRFSLTVHSPIFSNPDKYEVRVLDRGLSPFANNDCEFEIANAKAMNRLSDGIKTALYNFNYRNCLELPIESWFPNIKVKNRTKPNFIKTILKSKHDLTLESKRCYWIGGEVDFDGEFFSFSDKDERISYELPVKLGDWLYNLLSNICDNNNTVLLKCVIDSMPVEFFGGKEDFLENELWQDLRVRGLLLL